MTAGTPRFRMPAFSAAIFASVGAELLGVIHRDRRDDGRAPACATTLVVSSRPPSPTSSSSTSAGVSAKARNAAAVVISKWVMSSPSLIACVRVSTSTSASSPIGARLAVGAGERDALVEAHEMRRGVDVDALAGGLEHRLQVGGDRALAVGAGDVDDRRQPRVRDCRACRAAARRGRATDRSAADAAASSRRGACRSSACGPPAVTRREPGGG